MAAANGLPLYYYHIPAATHYDISIFDLFTMAQTELPQLMGVKYVNSDPLDWFKTISTFNDTHVCMFAPEPKVQSFGLGLGRGAVLAEDFYAPTYLRMANHFLRFVFQGGGGGHGSTRTQP